MQQHDTAPQFLRVRDFCRIANLPQSTAYRMIENGQLQAVRLAVSPANPRGVLRIPKSEVDRLLAKPE